MLAVWWCRPGEEALDSVFSLDGQLVLGDLFQSTIRCLNKFLLKVLIGADDYVQYIVEQRLIATVEIADRVPQWGEIHMRYPTPQCGLWIFKPCITNSPGQDASAGNISVCSERRCVHQLVVSVDKLSEEVPLLVIGELRVPRRNIDWCPGTHTV